jgi:O-acetyl-ADP-ribose deacetylase (regulator of RNase III)
VVAVTRGSKIAWTNPSVLRLAGDNDPITAIVERAREVALKAMDEGWTGPPFDPLQLAERLKLTVIPREDVRDARTLVGPNGRLRIEYNPNRSRERVRFSLAHEITHTLFDDCADRVRHRGHHDESEPDGWQLEVLCHVGGAEILMPAGSLPKMDNLDVDALLRSRAAYDVSPEAYFLRMVQVTAGSYAVVCASPTGPGRPYRVDYVMGSRAWTGPASRGDLLPLASIVSQCSGIGFTAKGDETWGTERLRVECFGLPPYPGTPMPRALCLTRPAKRASAEPAITFLRGDATRPRGAGPKIVAHVVNDATPNWGGAGFAQAVLRRWPQLQEDFRTWARSGPRSLSLGRVHLAEAEPATRVATLIAQHGYGASPSPRIRYGALRAALDQLARVAVDARATVHMPRIGCGQAGGDWNVVEELLSMTLAKARVPVYVYDRPGKEPQTPPQQSFRWAPS